MRILRCGHLLLFWLWCVHELRRRHLLDFHRIFQLRQLWFGHLLDVCWGHLGIDVRRLRSWDVCRLEWVNHLFVLRHGGILGE